MPEYDYYHWHRLREAGFPVKPMPDVIIDLKKEPLSLEGRIAQDIYEFKKRVEKKREREAQPRFQQQLEESETFWREHFKRQQRELEESARRYTRQLREWNDR